jgi:hypothetical protein
MPQIVRNPETRIVTKNGENVLSITVDPIVIEITINVNHDGNISVGENKPKVVEKEAAFIAPNFCSNTFGSNKVKFGKSIE